MEEKDIINGVPQKRRDKRVSFMVTEEERDFIKSIAGRTHYKSSSAFCRGMMLQICDLLENENISPITNISMGEVVWN